MHDDTKEPTQDLTRVETQPLAPNGGTQVAMRSPMDLLAAAVATGNMALVEKMMDLQDRFEKNEARKAFEAALAAAKAEIPVIRKNRHVGFEGKKDPTKRTDYNHEDLGEIARTIDPILGRHGLSYRFETTNEINEPIVVTCVVFGHGHSIKNTLRGGRDDSGSKNGIQATGSTLTYLQRYTLKAALGLAAAADDDGASSEGESEFISPEQVAALEQLIKDTGGDLAKFLQYAKVEKLGDLYASRYDAAVNVVKQAGEDRKKAKAKKTEDKQ
jgi:hypothetical protein